MYKRTDSAFVTDVARRRGGQSGNGTGIARCSENLDEIIIYTLEQQTGNPLDPKIISGIESVHTNELKIFTFDRLKFTIQKIAEKCPGIPSKGKRYNYSDASLPSGTGGTVAWVKDYKIDKSYSRFSPNSEKPIWLQEILSFSVGTNAEHQAETHDPNYSNSVFYDGGTGPTATTLSSKDLMIGNLIYGDSSRAPGNRDEGTPERRDVNPINFDWLNRNTSTSSSQTTKTQTFKWNYSNEGYTPEEKLYGPATPDFKEQVQRQKEEKVIEVF